MIDPRITSSCLLLCDWSLSQVFLKNNAKFPWFILVPKVDHIREIDELSQEQQHTLMNEISQLTRIVKTYFKPDKINVGALGNIVEQLHIHVIARFKHDDLWPHGVWQAQLPEEAYSSGSLETLKRAFLPLLT